MNSTNKWVDKKYGSAVASFQGEVLDTFVVQDGRGRLLL